MAPETLIFDLDGTLVDTLADLAAVLNEVLVERGAAPLSPEAVRPMVGDGARVLVGRALAARGLGEAHLEPALARFLRIYEQMPATRSVVYPGVRETLEAFAAAGHRLGICTNKPEAPTHALLDMLGMNTLFEAVIGGDSLPERKPSPEPVRAVMRQLPGEAVMVGDSRNDLLAGHAAGIPVVLVSYGFSAVPVAELGADRVIDDFGSLPAALDTLFGVRP